LRVVVAGAGMAGLVTAARLRELGVDVAVVEKGTRAGGSMLLSSCVPWRHREFDTFRAECPAGDARLQRIVWERLDESLQWLERATGIEPMWQDTNNPRTTGRRYDPSSLTDALVGRIGHDRLSLSAGGDIDVHRHHGDGDVDVHRHPDARVLATGGFPIRVAKVRGLLVRSNPWSEGDGLDYARGLGAATAGDLDELYARAMPAPPARVGEPDYVRASQLYGGRATVTNERGEEFFPGPPAWHENDLAQAIARQPGGTAWFELDRADADDTRVQTARELGGDVVATNGAVRVHVGAGVTHTLGGVRADERGRVLRDDGSPIEGLYAAGVDVGGVANGGYASGLAQALVQGLVVAESLAR
jgi:succinate dehydrogenase/fumarate reductase flavoprotein subunit